LNAGTPANVGVISLLSNYVPLDIGGGVIIQFDNDTVNGEIGTFNTQVLNGFQSFVLAPSSGSCVATPFVQFPPPSDPELNNVTYLDAGTLSIAGGQGPKPTQTVMKNANGKGYGQLVGGATIAQLLQGGGNPPYFLTAMTNSLGMQQPTGVAAPATYTVTGTGTGSVGPINASISVTSGAANIWKNWNMPKSGATIPRNQPLTITWPADSTDPNLFVDITMISSTVVGLLPGATTPGMFAECFAPASAGTFTIPTYVLSALPTNIGSNGMPNSNLAGELLVGPSFVMKETAPTGLDALYLFYHFIGGVPVSWQ
jgi:hypothetical protein